LHSTRSAAKTHSIPSDWFRLRSMNSIRSAPARRFRHSTPSCRRSTSDRILLIVGSFPKAVSGHSLVAGGLRDQTTLYTSRRRYVRDFATAKPLALVVKLQYAE